MPVLGTMRINMIYENVSDEIRKTLMESAAWDRMGLEPAFLNEDDDGEEAPAEEEAAAEDASEEEGAEEGSEEEVSDEEISEALATLLSLMSDDQLLEHIESVLTVVDKAAEVLEEEESEEAAS